MTLQSSLPTTTIELEPEPQIQVSVANRRLLGKLRVPHHQLWADIGRVIFLIPGVIPRADRLTQFLVMLELPRETPIVLVELANAFHSNLSNRKAITKLVASMQREYPAARHMTIQAVTWLEAMTMLVEEQDLLICFVGERSETGPFGKQPLSQALFDRFNRPTLEVAGALPGWESRFMGWIKRALFDLFPYCVVALFFWIQLQIGDQSDGWMSKVFLASTIVMEVLLVFVWSLFLS